MKLKPLNRYLVIFSLLSAALYLCCCARSAPANANTQSADTVAVPLPAASGAVTKTTAADSSIQTVSDSLKKPATAIRKFIKVDTRTYQVEVVINNVTEPKSFKKLLEKLPGGYTVEVDTAANPGVHFKPGELKYIWVDNYERNFSVTYTLKIPKHKKLITDYEGEFAYIDNFKKVSVKVQSSELNN